MVLLQEESAFLLKVAEMNPAVCCSCRCHKASDEKQAKTISNSAPPVPAPPPPPPLLCKLSPKKDTLSLKEQLKANRNGRLPAGVDASPDSASFSRRSSQDEVDDNLDDFTLPLPKPKIKLKPFIWNKIDGRRIFKNVKKQQLADADNLWQKYNALSRQNGVQLDFDKLEELFGQPNGPLSAAALGSGALSPAAHSKLTDSPINEKKRKEEVILLDAKRSLNINIFLKQFKGLVYNNRI